MIFKVREIFIYFISALFLEANAMYLSVYGFANIFYTNKEVSISLAIAFELCKVSLVLFFVKLTNEDKTIKTYIRNLAVLLFIIVLSMITSFGVYSYLSSSFTRELISIKDNQSKIIAIDKRISLIKDMIRGEEDKLNENKEGNKFSVYSEQLLKQSISTIEKETTLTRKRKSLSELSKEIDKVNSIQTQHSLYRNAIQLKIDSLYSRLFSEQEELNRIELDIQGKYPPEFNTIMLLSSKLEVTPESIFYLFSLVITLILDPLALFFIFLIKVKIEKEKRDNVETERVLEKVVNNTSNTTNNTIEENKEEKSNKTNSLDFSFNSNNDNNKEGDNVDVLLHKIEDNKKKEDAGKQRKLLKKTIFIDPDDILDKFKKKEEDNKENNKEVDSGSNPNPNNNSNDNPNISPPVKPTPTIPKELYW